MEEYYLGWHQKVIIYIPIKHNSQRVPEKNFRIINEEPLYVHTLLKYKDCKVFVDTDSDVIIKQVEEDSRLSNVTAFRRNPNLIGDTVSVCDLIEDFIHRFNISEPIAQIHVTSPFLNSDTLKSAYSLMKTDEYDSIVSCNVFQTRFWRKEDYGYCPINHNPLKLEQTQDLPEYYEENSAFYIFDPQVVLRYGTRIGTNPFFYSIKYPENIDIDTEEDWTIVKNLEGVHK